MYDENYCIILEDKIYSQRTPYSKFIKFDLNGIKQKTYETLPIEIKQIIEANEDLNNNPDNYIVYKDMGKYIKIQDIKDFHYPYIKIPSHIKNLPVKELDEEVFSDTREHIYQVHLPNTIEKLNPYTFLNCDCLENINLPIGIKEIPEYCFSFCTNLKNIQLSNIEIIKESAFQECESLKNIELNKIKGMEKNCFINCWKIEKININSNLTYIPELAFANCYELNELILPDTIEIIKKSAFHNCSNLKEFNIPKKLKSIENKAFFNNNLQNIILNKELEFIDEESFNRITNNNQVNVYIYPKTKYKDNSFTKNTNIMTIKNIDLER